MGGGQSLAERGRGGTGPPSHGPRAPKAPKASPSREKESPNSPESGILSPKEMELVLQTWTVMGEDIVGNGVRVFLRINQLEPSIIQAFPFRDLSIEELPKSPLFRGHASRFMKAVEVTLEHLGALEVIVIPNLIHLGKAHARIRGFKVEYLQVFQRAMVDIWQESLGKQFKGECKEGWIKIFSFVTLKVLEGYEVGLSEMEQDSDPQSRRSFSGQGQFRFPTILNSNNSSPARLPQAETDARLEGRGLNSNNIAVVVTNNGSA